MQASAIGVAVVRAAQHLPGAGSVPKRRRPGPDQAERFQVVGRLVAAAAGVDEIDPALALQRRLELLYPGRHSLDIRKEEDTFITELTLQYP